MPEPFLDAVERRKLIAILAGLYDFTDLGARGRRVFLQDAAGLGRFVPGLDLSGSPPTAAGDIVGRLERFGELPERPNYHALGALLTAMLSLNEIEPPNGSFLAGLIVRYGLVADAAYVDKLRSTYHVTGEPLRQPSVPSTPVAAAAPEPPPSPPFKPTIVDESHLESVLNSEDNFLDIHLLRGALYSARAVGRIELPEGNPRGTGFLVGPDMLLTNQHVLQAQDELEEAVVRFEYVNDPSGIPVKGTITRFKRDFYHASGPEELDYALVRLQDAPLQRLTPKGEEAAYSIWQLLETGRHKGYLSMAPRLLVPQLRVNIIQHPAKDPLKVVLTQNYVSYVTPTRVQYVADTMNGSSGSPVLNSNWEVVALHHSGSPYPAESLADTLKKAWKGRFRVNEGVPMRAILDDFKKRNLDRYLPAV